MNFMMDKFIFSPLDGIQHEHLGRKYSYSYVCFYCRLHYNNHIIKMKARQILREYVIKSKRDKVGVIAICRNPDNHEMFWYHVHANERLPDAEHGCEDIAIHIRPMLKDRKGTSFQS